MVLADGILSDRILRLIGEKGWTGLNALQLMAARPIKEGKNTVISAPTGYGKTEAAILPILDLMLTSERRPLSLVYITPMKALINDITERISWWAARLGFRVSRKHGDVPVSEKNRRRRLKPDILVTTPESLEIDLDWSPTIRDLYKNTRWVIIDEIHELTSSKRGIQLSLLLERLRFFFRIDPQIVMLSATLSNPELISRIFVGSSKRELSVVMPERTKAFRVTIDYVDPRESAEWWDTLVRKIREQIEPLTIIFAPSRHFAEKLHAELEKRGVRGVGVHHSSVSGDIKESLERRMRSGNIEAVITTRTLELGIDIGEAKKALIIGAPSSPFSLLQKVGRTGHRMDGVSVGIIFTGSVLEVVQAVAVSLGLDGRDSAKETGMLDCPLDVIARETVALALGGYKLSPQSIHSIVVGSGVCEGFSLKKAYALLDELVGNGLLSFDGKDYYSIGPMFYKIWRFSGKNSRWWAHRFPEFFSFITDRGVFQVRSGDTFLGELDSMFVYRHLRVGDTIRLGGSSWRVLDIDENNNRIEVEKVKTSVTEAPYWRGDFSLLSEEVTASSLELLYKLCSEGEGILDSHIELTPEAARAVRESCGDTVDIFYRLRNSELLYAEDGKELVIVNPRGSRINETLGYLLLYEASSSISLTSYFKSSPYGVLFSSPLDLEEVLGRASNREKLWETMKKAVIRSPLFYPVLREVQVSFGIVGKARKSNMVVEEALRQIMHRYLDLEGLWNIIAGIRGGTIKISRTSVDRLPSFIIDDLHRRPFTRVWLRDLSYTIINTLSGWPFTVDELSDILGLPPKSIESKLKELRRSSWEERVFRFYDVETGEWRWGLVRNAFNIALSEEFRKSFSPTDPSQLFRLNIRGDASSSYISKIVSYKMFIGDRDRLLGGLPFDEIYEMKVEPLSPVISRSFSPYYYNFPKKILPILFANAVVVLQNSYY